MSTGHDAWAVERLCNSDETTNVRWRELGYKVCLQPACAAPAGFLICFLRVLGPSGRECQGRTPPASHAAAAPVPGGAETSRAATDLGVGFRVVVLQYSFLFCKCISTDTDWSYDSFLS